MKILHKYRRLIGVLLTFTVSVMLLVSTIPASAATVDIPYFSKFPYGTISTFGEGSRAVYSTSKAIHFTSSGGAGSVIAFNSGYSSLARCYRNEDNNSDIVFTFTGSSNIVNYINDGTLGLVLVFRGMKGEIISWRYCTPFGYQPISSDTLLFIYTVRSYFQSQILDYYGFGQADLVGIGLGTSGAIDCHFTFKSLEHTPKTDSNEYTDIEDSDDSSGSSVISTLLKKLFSFNQTKLGLSFGILGSLITTSIDSLTDSIVSKLDFLGNLLSVVWSGAKPVLKPLYEEVLLPSLDSILNSVNVISTKTVEILSPVLADMINFFSPYFNQIMDIITNNFLNLVTNLTPLVNQFVTAISPSLDGIVTNISKNISKIFNECFVPSDTSTEYQEFVGMKNDISNKFPVFNQLKSFVTVLFNPDTYEASSGSNTFDTVTGQWLIHNTGSYAYSKFGQVVELDPTKTYIYSVSYKYIVKNGSMPFLQYYNGQKFVNCSYPDTTSGTDSWYNYTLEFKPSSNCYVFSNGKVKMLIGLTTGNLGSNTYFTNFYLYEKTDSSKKNLFINSDFNHGLYGWTSAGYDDKAISQYGVMSTKFGEIELLKYYNQQAVSEDFVVNIYGNKLSVLNFDWYMPYKHYGDICVIAFCYLAFIWHTFKRLPNII